MLLLAVGLAAGSLLLVLLGLLLCALRWRREQRQYEELVPTLTVGTARPTPVIMVSQGIWTNPSEIPFTLPPRFAPRNHEDLRLTEIHEKQKEEKEVEEEEKAKMEEIKMPTPRDILAHRGSLSVRSWYPVGTVLAGLYSGQPVSEVVAPPPGMATRLCFSVEYRHSSEQLMVSLLRLGNLPPRFHGNKTLVELRLLPDDRRPRQAKARGTGPDPEFNDCFVFQVSGVSVSQSTLSVCVLSVTQDCKRQAVGRVLFTLEGELGQAGRVLWRDLDPEDHTQHSELGDVLVSLSYSPSLQRLSVVAVRARGLQLLSDAGVCVQVSLRIHTQVVKVKCSGVIKADADPHFNHRMTFKLRVQHLDEACLRFELQQVTEVRTDPVVLLGALVLGPFMYARGLQLQHWMDMINAPQESVKMWHGLSRAT